MIVSPKPLNKLDACPIVQYAAIRTLYLNLPKGHGFFENTFRGICEIVDATTATDDAELVATASAGIISYFLNLKAVLHQKRAKMFVSINNVIECKQF